MLSTLKSGKVKLDLGGEDAQGDKKKLSITWEKSEVYIVYNIYNAYEILRSRIWLFKQALEGHAANFGMYVFPIFTK